jgi:hypothetical protein
MLKVKDPFDAFRDDRLSPDLADVYDALCRVVRTHAPHAIAAMKWHVPTYSQGRVIAAIVPGPGYLRLTFFHGADLDDPDRLLEGAGARVRHVKVRTPSEASITPVVQLIAQAFARA